MKTTTALLALAAALAATPATADEALRREARQLFGTIETPAGDAHRAPLAELGRALFWDARVSADGKTACASCHSAEDWGGDRRRTPVDARGKAMPRNSPTVFNSLAQPALRWLADRKSGAELAEGLITGPLGFGSKPEAVERLLALGYEGAFRAAFPGEAQPVSAAHYAKALESYQATLLTPAPFDRFLAGDDRALDERQQAGLRKFVAAGCAGCHGGPLLGGTSVQKFGLARDYWTVTGSANIDPGLFAATKKEEDRYRFRVPMLRNVARTAPYFHDGSVASLERAVQVMSATQLGRDMTAAEAGEIAGFLESLTGERPKHFAPPEKVALEARADAVIDWNIRANEAVVEARLGTPPAMRVMAIVQTAVLAAAEAARPDASLDAAVAAANRTALARLLPAQQATVERAYQAALAAIPEGAAKAAGIAAGERAAAAVLAARADDGAGSPAAYRPHTTAGAYVPTAAPAAPHWGQRKPWLMRGASQFRPAPPPALASSTWAREYNEVKALGARTSSVRTAEQTEIAQFWEYSLPPIYHQLVRSAAALPGRQPAQNARLFAAASQALDDALIAVFEAKYHYNYWRPVTAIRNGDIDGNPVTERDAGWTPLHEAPMHPEYPSGHAILAGALGAVLEAELAGASGYVLSTSSPSAKNAVRRWTRVSDFVQEVADARIYAGIHFRSAVDAGTVMGRQIGALAVERVLAP